MTGIVWQANIVDLQGNVVPAANVEVREQFTGTLVTMYQDFELTTPFASNPAQTDGFGFIRFFLEAPGLYRIRASKGGFSRQWTHVLFSDPFTQAVSTVILDPPALAAGNVNDWDAGIAATPANGYRVRVIGNAGGSILTGMQGGANGRRAILTNVGADAIVIPDDSPLSAANHRFRMNGDLFWPPGVSHEFLYESAILRWSKLGN